MLFKSVVDVDILFTHPPLSRSFSSWKHVGSVFLVAEDKDVWSTVSKGQPWLSVAYVQQIDNEQNVCLFV